MSPASMLSPMGRAVLQEVTRGVLVARQSYAEERADREAHGARITGVCWYCDRPFDPSLRPSSMTAKAALLFCSAACESLDGET